MISEMSLCVWQFCGTEAASLGLRVLVQVVDAIDEVENDRDQLLCRFGIRHAGRKIDPFDFCVCHQIKNRQQFVLGLIGGVTDDSDDFVGFVFLSDHQATFCGIVSFGVY